MEDKSLDGLGGIVADVQPLSGSGTPVVTEKQWEHEAKMLRKKVAGYKSYVARTNRVIDELHSQIERYEKEDVRQSVQISSLESRVCELLDGNNRVVESLNEANDEIVKLKTRLREIGDMPWWRRIFLDV